MTQPPPAPDHSPFRPQHDQVRHIPPPRPDPRMIRQALTGAGVLGILVWLAWSIAAQLASATVSGNTGTISALHEWCSANASTLSNAGAERSCALISDGYLLAAVVFWLSIAAFVATLGLLLMAASPWKRMPR